MESHFRYLLILFLALASCTKESTTELEEDLTGEISNIPQIELVSQGQTEVVAYQDSLVFTISYIDGNGDLGSPNPDNPTVFLIDNRDPDQLIFSYHLSPRAPAGNDIAIQGTLDVVLQNTIILDSGNSQETTSFSIYIQDEAGQQSNTVESQTIQIVEE